ncbi:MAG: HPP family protein [Bacillota bacterium]
MSKRDKGDFSLVQSSGDEDIYILSKNLKERWFNYLWQGAAAGVVTFVVLYVFVELIALVILGGVGSTFFTVFALPNLRTTYTRNIIGSYLICISIGLFCTYIDSPSLSGGVAIASAAFFMVITDTEHPPAAGAALGLSMAPNIDDAYSGAVFSFAGAILAVLLRRLLLPWLKDLV